jgi:hypothetical protein
VLGLAGCELARRGAVAFKAPTSVPGDLLARLRGVGQVLFEEQLVEAHDEVDAVAAGLWHLA